MLQRYFVGDLRPDQEKLWKADDGIFVLYTGCLAELDGWKKVYDEVVAENNKICQTLDKLRKEFAKKNEINNHNEAVLSETVAQLNTLVAEKDKQIATLKRRKVCQHRSAF